MKRNQLLLIKFRWVIALFLILLSLEKNYSQQGSASGTITFTEGLDGWTKLNCKTDYSFELNDNNIQFFTSNYEMSIAADAKYRFEGKEYSKADLGLNNWPTDSETDYIKVSLDIKYKGQTLKSFQSFQLVDYALKVGAFDNYANIADKEKGKRSAYVGNINIPLEGFNISDFSASIRNFAGNRNSMIASSEIEALIKKKLTATKSNNSNNSIIINSSTASNKSYSNGSTATSTTNDANTRYQNEMTKYNEEIAKAENKRKTDAAQAKQMGDDIADFAGTVINSFMEQSARNNEIKNAQFLSGIENRKRNEEKAKLAFKYFLPEAEKGNEYAIEKVIEAHLLIGKPQAYYREIIDDYFSGEPKEYLEFLEGVQQKFNSPIAKRALIIHYETVTSKFKDVARYHRKRAITQFIFGGIIAAAGIYGGEAIYELESQTAEENNEVGDYILSSAVTTVGVLGGAACVVSGIVHLVRIGQANNDEYNSKAKTKLSYYLINNGVTFLPVYNIQNNNFGLAVNIKF